MTVSESVSCVALLNAVVAVTPEPENVTTAPLWKPVPVTVIDWFVAPCPREAGLKLVIVGGVPIVIENALVVVAPAPSASMIVKFDVATCVGVPEMTPVLAFRFRPAGSVPTDTDQVSGAVPPVFASVVE